MGIYIRSEEINTSKVKSIEQKALLKNIFNFFQKYKQNISVSDLIRFINLGSDISYINNKILGVMISTHIPTNQENLTFISHLFAKKNHGKYLIEKCVNPHCFITPIPYYKNHICIYNWMFPLNLKGYGKRKFSINSKIIKVRQYNSLRAFRFYQSETKNKKIYFNPDYEYWKKWVICFPTYLVEKNSEILGLFSYNFTTNKREIIIGNPLLCIGEQPRTLICLLYQTKDTVNIMNLYQIGSITEKYLKYIEAIKTNYIYLNFSNEISLKPLDIFIPLI